MATEDEGGKVVGKRIGRVLRCFDAAGRLQRWPSKRSEQILALWAVWSFLPSRTRFDELEISSLLRSWHDYDDYALLRRELCDHDLLRRTPDGRIYQRVEQDMPADAAELVSRLRAELRSA